MERPILAAFLSCLGPHLTDAEKRIFAHYNPLGVTIFGRNIVTPTQLKDLCNSIKDVVERDDILLAVDQEGGRVRRLQGNGFFDEVSQKKLGSLPEETAQKATQLHCQLISEDLKRSGLNLNFAPVLDLEYDNTTEALKGRCFGSEPSKVAQLGKVMVETYMANGICPCLKHMPGHGRAQCDPHLGLPIINASIKELENDFYPFQRLNDAPAGMSAHIMLSEIDDKNPTTFSPLVINEIIRGVIGFKGFLISDAIDMKALPGSLGEKTQASLHAGCEAVCYCAGEENGLEEVCQNCINLSDKSLIKFAKIKNILQNKPKFKTSAEDYYALVGKEKYNYSYDATEVLNQMLQKDVNKGEKNV